METLTSSWALGITLSIVGFFTISIIAILKWVFGKIVDRLEKTEKQVELITGVNILVLNHLSEDEKFARELDRFYNTINAAKG